MSLPSISMPITYHQSNFLVNRKQVDVYPRSTNMRSLVTTIPLMQYKSYGV